MRLKTFTQSYLLIQCNSSFVHSLVKRGAAVTNTVVILGIALYAWYPSRHYATERIN